MLALLALVWSRLWEAVPPWVEEPPPPVLQQVPDWIPAHDEITPFFSPLPHPTWGAVWDWVKSSSAEVIHLDPDPADVHVQSLVQKIVDATVGQTIKALSSYVNRLADLSMQYAQINAAYTQRVDVEGHRVTHNIDQRAHEVERALNLVVNQALPQLWQRIADDQRQGLLNLEHQSNADRQWATDNIFSPLADLLGQVNHDLDTKISLHAQEAHDYTDARILQSNLAHAGEFVGISAAVNQLRQFNDECAVPMCEAMGPKTDLGKLLKALKIAAAAAILVEFASLDENGIEGVLGKLADYGGQVIHTFDTLFVGGGRTLGEIVTATGAG